MHTRRYGGMAGAWMKARLIPNDDVLRLRIALRDLLQELAAGFQIDAAAEKRLRGVLAIDLQRGVQIAPGVLV